MSEWPPICAHAQITRQYKTFMFWVFPNFEILIMKNGPEQETTVKTFEKNNHFLWNAIKPYQNTWKCSETLTACSHMSLRLVNNTNEPDKGRKYHQNVKIKIVDVTIHILDYLCIATLPLLRVNYHDYTHHKHNPTPLKTRWALHSRSGLSISYLKRWKQQRISIKLSESC